jgi:hypothetical protein
VRRKKTPRAGVENLVRFEETTFLADIREASVVTLFLPQINLKSPKLPRI